MVPSRGRDLPAREVRSKPALLILGLPVAAIAACLGCSSMDSGLRARRLAQRTTAYGEELNPPECGDPSTPGSERRHCFQTTFPLDRCTMVTRGRNRYFVLEPGFVQEFSGREGREEVRLRISILDETRVVNGSPTRVLEEREWIDGELAEVSRNFISMCEETGDVYYFGEEVDMFRDGRLVSHSGAWLAGEDGATAGLFLPGSPRVGDRFYQEIGRGALDRAEIASLSVRRSTAVGRFARCLELLESNPLEPHDRETKIFAPGIGLIVDGALEIVSYSDPRK